MAGRRVFIGSRDIARAREAAASLSPPLAPGAVGGALNQEVASRADIVFVAVPYAAHRETLTLLKEYLAGKVVVDVVAPLAFNKGRARAVPVPEGSAALQAQAILPESRVVAAFQTVSAQDLLASDKPVNTDVVVCADDDEARTNVMELAEGINGVRAVNGGGLENARYVEDFTALLLNINRIYKAHTSIKIVGI
jgi:NADPH-dependent F420 reductase